MDPTLFIRHRQTFFSFCILFIDLSDRIESITLVRRFTVCAFLSEEGTLLVGFQCDWGSRW